MSFAQVLHIIRYDYYWPSSAYIGLSQLLYALGLTAIEQVRPNFRLFSLPTSCFLLFCCFEVTYFNTSTYQNLRSMNTRCTTTG
jgi:hypothetical protein